QIQVVPIAPQANVQNVNVLAGDVEQGNANNANTGQAAQQENTQSGTQHGSYPTKRVWDGKQAGGASHAAAQRNDSDQHQVQVVPVAPQLNLQNVNVLSGHVEQGNANNANTGQATQQENTRVSWDRKAPGGNPCGDWCPPRHEPKPCPPKHEPKPCPPKDEAKPCPPKHEPKPCPPSHGSKPDHGTPAAQQNDSSQKQVQILPIAPQLNVQNVNVLSGGVTQGNANNANTGQATQQSNTQLLGLVKGGGLL
ncbi:MAG TPA: hypothetical protein VJ689_03335, partial [Gaiellaceae bacterium]|nr:hypothetical protein [Gaiellaceae bacterium]